jgi:hypothetical protein
MIEVPTRRSVGEVELHKVDAAISLNQEELLFLIEHPLEGGERAVQTKDLLAEPLPVASVEDKDMLLEDLRRGDTVDGQQG